MTALKRERLALNRGYKNITCPLGDCDYQHRFLETDYTIDDGKATERRLAFLRQHHSAGHPIKASTPGEIRYALVFNELTRLLSEADITAPLAVRRDIATRVLYVLDQQQST